MKTILTFAFVCFAYLAKAQSGEDQAQIKAACLDYVEGFFTQDSTRLKKSMHPALVKRIIDNRTGKSQLATIGLHELISYLKPAYKMADKNSAEPFKADITIYDVSNGIALAKIATNKMSEFFDYVQLGKIDGDWKIINVLWAFNQ